MLLKYCRSSFTGLLKKHSIAAIKNYPLSIIALSIIATSCNTHQHPGKKIFHYNESSGIASLDPAFAKNKQVMWAVHQLYNTLVEIDSNMQLAPSLAKRWVISPDNLTFTFYLRTDVFFTDDDCFANGKGRPLTAQDVAYSFKRIVDKNTASPARGYLITVLILPKVLKQLMTALFN